MMDARNMVPLQTVIEKLCQPQGNAEQAHAAINYLILLTCQVLDSPKYQGVSAPPDPEDLPMDEFSVRAIAWFASLPDSVRTELVAWP